MLAVELDGAVVGATTTTSTTFPTSTVMSMATSTVTAPAVVAGTGVGLLPLVTVAAATGEADPRSLLVPVPTLGGSNPVGGSCAGSTTSSSTTGVNNSSSNITSNPTAMEQAEELVKPTILKDGQMYLEVECGQNKAAMYLSRLCQGSKGPCINFQGSWLTPNEFQFVSGRETAKDWKRSIRHHGKSLKLLLAKGYLTVHPTMCDCEGCRIGAVLTRKGERRRIPNGERKRKSPGNAPENSGNGVFRSVGNVSSVVKNEDGPSEAKRPTLDKPAEGAQSPLKESTMMNVPADVKEESSAVRQTDSHVPDVGKMAMDSRLIAATPLVPRLSPERVPDMLNGYVSVLPPKEHKEASTTSKQSSSAHPVQSSISVMTGAVSPPLDVKVLSSSNGNSALDKSMSRLALYHAVSASVKGLGTVGVQKQTPPLGVSTLPCDQTVPSPIPSNPNSNTDTEMKEDSVRDGQALDVRSPPAQPDSSELIPKAENKADVANLDTVKTEAKDLTSEDVSQSAVNHSIVSYTKLCEPNNNNSSSSNSSSISISVSTPSSLASSLAAVTSPVTATAAPAASSLMLSVSASDTSNFCNDIKAKCTEPSSSIVSTSSHSKHSEKEEHITIRHPSPDRHPQNTFSSTKHSPLKPPKEHTSEKHKDRRHENGSLSSSLDQKERHCSKDVKESSSSRHDRDSERRRQEERADKDRKSGTASGPSSKPDEDVSRGQEFPVAGGSGRVEGIPTSTPVVPSVPVPAPVPDPAAYSEYMRVLAASHNGFVPPAVGCIPGMFPLRPPTDVSLSSAAMMHPMQAAACGMFSTPAALLPKEPVMYPTTGALPPASYAYGTPGMTPMSLIPSQYSSAASAASLLDYSRPFHYLPWTGVPLMMPDAMNAAAVAAAAGSPAKRSREELESAMDISGKRLPLPVPPYGMGSVTPMDYMAAYRGLAVPLSCGLESSIYDKNAELLRKRMYPELAASVGGSSKSIDSPYLASLPECYRALYCCRCMENQPDDIRTWSVEEVVKLVSSLEGCSVYSEIFREQRVDGKILVLLTTDHLMKNLGMKLAPAMMLTNRVAKLLLNSTRTSGCGMCRRLASMVVPAVQSAVGGYT